MATRPRDEGHIGSGSVDLLLPAQRLPDGSYLSCIYPSEKDRRHKTNGIKVRVIDSRLDGVADAEPIYRMVTSILDHEQAPAKELAALYHERWETETALGELKTRLRGARVILRSKTPGLVRQEGVVNLRSEFIASVGLSDNGHDGSRHDGWWRWHDGHPEAASDQRLCRQR